MPLPILRTLLTRCAVVSTTIMLDEAYWHYQPTPSGLNPISRTEQKTAGDTSMRRDFASVSHVQQRVDSAKAT